MDDAFRELGTAAARSLREGRGRDAADLFRQMTQLRPEHADSWFNLGYSLRLARDYQAAFDAYGEALERGVSSPEEVHLNRAAILADHLHRTSEAEDEIGRALAVNPSYLTAWLNLGSLKEDLGDAEGALDAYRQALEIQPGNGRALARQAVLDVHAGEADPVIARLSEALPGVRRTPEDLAEAYFALGHALDAAGRHDEAFDVIHHANALAGDARPPAQRYDRGAHQRLIDALIATPLPDPAPASTEAPRPLFICGMFRSGSTLAEQLLGRHPGIDIGGELEMLPALVDQELEPYPEALARASADRLIELRSRYVAAIAAVFPGSQLVTDKRPDNFLHVGLIKSLFPDARIVHTRRDPLDTILSTYFLYFGTGVGYSERLDDIVHYYGQYRRLMDHWGERFGADILHVDYDLLVRDPRSQLEPVLGALGLDWDEAILRGDGQRPAVRTASAWQVRKALHTRSSGRWRNYAKQLGPVRRQLQSLGLINQAPDESS